jgi:hypothetical protein
VVGAAVTNELNLVFAMSYAAEIRAVVVSGDHNRSSETTPWENVIAGQAPVSRLRVRVGHAAGVNPAKNAQNPGKRSSEHRSKGPSG